MFKFISKIISFFKKLVTRPGLQQFLGRYEQLAMKIVADLALVHSNEDFHHWKDVAWEEVQKATGELRGNWIAILVAFAFENLKAQKPSA